VAARDARRKLWVALGLVVLVAGVYGQVGGHQFVDFDDSEYVYENPNVAAGLSGPAFAWALTAFHSANWHPVTWMSHMLDVSLFGLSPGPHHLVNAAFHAANAVLLFLVLETATAAFWPSAVVAALFAVHPLNVETVAWISQRKGVLSTTFLLLAVGAYARLAGQGRKRTLVVAALLALGLLSKPMLVSAPLLLLAMDFWPLNRGETSTRQLLVEKLPYVSLVAGVSVLTVLAQAAGNAVAPVATYPIGERVANALVSVARYLFDFLWPASLACFYPHPASIGTSTNLLAAAAAAALLLAVTILVFRLRQSRPWLLFGWAWFLFSLAPVIGIVQVGSQSSADRYMYVPLIGIFVAVVWEAAETLRRHRPLTRIAAAACALVLGAFGVLAFRQTATWRDAETLYNRALSVTRDNWLVTNNLGTVYMRRGEQAGALARFRESARIKPDYEEAHYNAGLALTALQRPAEAVDELRINLDLAPGNTDGWASLGYALMSLGRAAEARRAFDTALSQRPGDAMSLHGAGAASTVLGDFAGAERYLARLELVDKERASELRRGLATDRARLSRSSLPSR
jgi:Flp pilus assembly protein TadD